MPPIDDPPRDRLPVLTAILSKPWLSEAILLPLILGSTLVAQQGPALSIRVKAEVKAEDLARLGRANLRLSFHCNEAPGRSLAVRLEVRAAGKKLWSWDHGPMPATGTWKKGKDYAYETPLTYPLELKLPNGTRGLTLHLAFYDLTTRKLLSPEGAGGGRMLKILALPLPRKSAADSAKEIDAVIARALDMAKKKPARAWLLLDASFRRTEDYAQKARLRDALLQVGTFPARPMSLYEQQIVAARIRAEKVRYLKLVASRMYGRGQLHGAYMILEKVGGALQEGVDDAHVGSIGDVRRATKNLEDLRRKILERLTPEIKKRVKAAQAKYGDTPRLFDHAMRLRKKKEWAEAKEILRDLSMSLQPKLSARAKEALDKLNADWLADIPEEERRIADEAIHHPSWARTKTRVTHQFVLIGPERLLAGVPAASALRFDVAYIYLTDLFGRVPNPQGDRVTVYFKELWDFGGGQGGGKIIDIGNARADARKTRLDTGLFYHEFTHCVDDTRPVFGGLHEGLADFGASFAFQSLAQGPGQRWTPKSSLKAFRRDYLDRDLVYWRIPNYGPSAGFLLYFMQQYGRKDGAWHWELYRRFFRAYRADDIKDGRTPTVFRALGYRLAEVFGPTVWKDLARFRIPLMPRDAEAIAKEEKEAGSAWLPEEKDFAGFPGSPVPRDVRAVDLADEQAGLDSYVDKLGIVKDWHVIGPFKEEGVDPDAGIFAPEWEIDLQRHYDVPNNTAIWRMPRPGRRERINDNGWVSFHYTYMDHSAIYAITHITVPEACDARIHMRGDDDLTLFVNDEAIGKYRNQGGRALGPWRPGAGLLLPDATRFPVRLKAGRNKVLVKIRNRTGGAGFILAVSRPDGKPIEGWRSDTRPPDTKSNRGAAPNSDTWPKRAQLTFKSRGPLARLKTTGGRFRVRNKALEGVDRKGGLPWRKYTVRPGFKRDSPSNLTWLAERLTKDIDDFRLRVDLDCRQSLPKLCVIFEGEGNKDPLSGWTLILIPSGKGIQARLERYGRLIHQSSRIELPKDLETPLRLELLLHRKRFSASFAGKPLFTQTPLRLIAGRHRIGLATWSETTRITALSLRSTSHSSR